MKTAKAGMGRVRIAAIVVTAAGLMATLALLYAFGIGDVLAIVRRIGLIGFALYTSYTFVILAVLGLAWFAVAPGLDWHHLPTFIWGRTTREAATDVLPFSQFGGIIVGARSIVARGVAQPLTYASLVADQTTELAAQLVYTLYGVAMFAFVLNAVPAGNALLLPALGGLAVSTAIIMGFAVAQRPLLVFGARLAATLLPGSGDVLADLPVTLDAIYRQRRRVIASFLLHIVTWVGSGAGAWIALALIGAEVPLMSVIVIESLIFTLRTAAFLVPGGIGVQEGAYVLIGPLFGLPPEAALALSLLKRARDLAIGIPVMLAWIAIEARH